MIDGLDAMTTANVEVALSDFDVSDTPSCQSGLNVDEVSVPELVVNEVLCFVQQRCSLLTFDDLVKICADFYNDEEIEQARLLLTKFVPSKRIGKPQGAKKVVATRTVSALVKVCLDPGVQLPTFCAANIARLPAVDASHVDISAILIELSALRSQVRAIDELRSQLHVIDELRSEVADLRKMLSVPVATYGISTESIVGVSSNVDSAPPVEKLFTDHVRELKAAGGMSPAQNHQAKPSKPVRKPVVGSSMNNKSIKSVNTKRTIDVFVSRLHPMTSLTEIEDCVKESNIDGMQIHAIHCEKLKSRYEHLYMSARVQIEVNSVDMKRAIDLYMSGNAWPVGVFVRRYFPPKVQNGET